MERPRHLLHRAGMLNGNSLISGVGKTSICIFKTSWDTERDNETCMEVDGRQERAQELEEKAKQL
jgi:hypothetical protein